MRGAAVGPGAEVPDLPTERVGGPATESGPAAVGAAAPGSSARHAGGGGPDEPSPLVPLAGGAGDAGSNFLPVAPRARLAEEVAGAGSARAPAPLRLGGGSGAGPDVLAAVAPLPVGALAVALSAEDAGASEPPAAAVGPDALAVAAPLAVPVAAPQMGDPGAGPSEQQPEPLSDTARLATPAGSESGVLVAAPAASRVGDGGEGASEPVPLAGDDDNVTVNLPTPAGSEPGVLAAALPAGDAGPFEVPELPAGEGEGGEGFVQLPTPAGSGCWSEDSPPLSVSAADSEEDAEWEKVSKASAEDSECLWEGVSPIRQ